MKPARKVVNSSNISVYITQIVTGVEVTVGNCFPEVLEILADAEGGEKLFPKLRRNNYYCYTSSRNVCMPLVEISSRDVR